MYNNTCIVHVYMYNTCVYCIVYVTNNNIMEPLCCGHCWKNFKCPDKRGVLVPVLVLTPVC